MKKILDCFHENHKNLSEVYKVLDRVVEGRATDKKFEFIGESFCDGVIITKVKDIFDTLERVQEYMLKYRLHAYSIKGANMRD